MLKSRFGNLEKAIRKLSLQERGQRKVVSRFHELFYGTQQGYRPWMDVTWMGVKTLKCPMDLWIFQEILWECRPDWIVESGTYQGGSAFFLACMCEWMGAGRVISVDIDPQQHELPVHPRIHYLSGSSTRPEVFAQVQQQIGQGAQVMVILDSDHHFTHVTQELRLYSQLVSKGQYLVVEDTNLNGNPVQPDFGPGPREAVRQFMAHNPDFIVDQRREKLYLTFNPEGFLRRVR